MRVLGLVLAMAVVTAPLAIAQTEAPPPAPAGDNEPQQTTPSTEATEAAGAQSQEPVCRSTARSESRLRSRPERVCRTQSEWDALQQRSNRSNQSDHDQQDGE